VLKNKFKNINIYGKRIFIRSFSPEEDIKLLEDILKSLRISDFEITQISVPLQEAFVDFIRASENNYV
jgi:ABC-2 type transport system ATP-binding protein